MKFSDLSFFLIFFLKISFFNSKNRLYLFTFDLSPISFDFSDFLSCDDKIPIFGIIIA